MYCQASSGAAAIRCGVLYGTEHHKSVVVISKQTRTRTTSSHRNDVIPSTHRWACQYDRWERMYPCGPGYRLRISWHRCTHKRNFRSRMRQSKCRQLEVLSITFEPFHRTFEYCCRTAEVMVEKGRQRYRKSWDEHWWTGVIHRSYNRLKESRYQHSVEWTVQIGPWRYDEGQNSSSQILEEVLAKIKS